MANKSNEWAKDEFGDAVLGDKRLTDRLNIFDEAVEKVSWYCLRWKIEIFHKILKSGLKVEECRLETAERLMRYLTVMSIIAWRILFITSIASNITVYCLIG